MQPLETGRFAARVHGVVMPRTITDHEMKRRQAMAAAKAAITDAMSGHELTALEWVNVLAESMQRMIGHGLIEEWNDETEVA